MAAPFDPTAESHRARGLAHQFKQDAGLVFPDTEHKTAKTRELIKSLRAADRPADADAIEQALDAWCAVHVDPHLALVDELEARARGFGRPVPSASLPGEA